MNIGKIVLAAVFTFSICGCSANAAFIEAVCPQIQYFGRWEKNPSVYRCAQGATYIKANFTGTSLYAYLEDSNAWWRVSIDGGEFRRFRPRGKHTMLAENLSQGEHKVLLVRSTEGRAGVSEFRGFYIDDDAQILPPDLIPIICIEPIPSVIPSYAGEWINEAVMAQKEKGDNKLYYIAINEGQPLLDPSDYAGDNTHPLKSGAKKIALFLKDKVAGILGW